MTISDGAHTRVDLPDTSTWHDFDPVDAERFQHADGQECVQAKDGVWLIAGQGLDVDAECPQPHDNPDLPDATADGYDWPAPRVACPGCTGNPAEHPNDPVTITSEAESAVYGPRESDYGHPREDFTRQAVLWTGLLQHKLADGEYIEAEDIARCMVAVKLARDVHSPKRDNRVDGAGYFLTLDRLATGK